MNKQLIIHIVAELIIVGTVSILFNKRINKLEESFANLQKDYSVLAKSVEYLEKIVFNQANQIKHLLSNQTQPQPYHHSQSQQTKNVSQPQRQNQDINAFMNPLSLFQTLNQSQKPSETKEKFGFTINPIENIIHMMTGDVKKESKNEDVNCEIIPDEQIEYKVGSSVIVTNENQIDSDDEESIVNETLHTLLDEEKNIQKEEIDKL